MTAQRRQATMTEEEWEEEFEDESDLPCPTIVATHLGRHAFVRHFNDPREAAEVLAWLRGEYGKYGIAFALTENEAVLAAALKLDWGVLLANVLRSRTQERTESDKSEPTTTAGRGP